MFNLQGSEIIVILLLALVVLGPEKLPDAIRRFSKTYGELKKMGSGFQSELKSALDEPVNEMRKTADMVRDAADPDKIAAEARDEPVAAASAATTDKADGADKANGADEPEPSSETVAAPPQGDPPLVAADRATQVGDADGAPSRVGDGAAGEAAGDPSGDQPRRINHVAAANSSGAIAASAATHDDEPATPPPGPAFHSAGPRTITTPALSDTDADAELTVAASVEADESESSDEAATA